MSETRLAEIRARLDAAISGPWYVHEDDDGNLSVLLNHADGGVIATVEPGRTARADAFLIAYAPTDLAYLLDEIARLTRELEEARERERTVRSAVIRSVAALVRLDPRWDPREETEWVRRGPVVRTALRIKDDVLALATPPAEGDGDAD